MKNKTQPGSLLCATSEFPKILAHANLCFPEPLLTTHGTSMSSQYTLQNGALEK